jgi:DNA invertase Pin-like site-specific DNA recombinase
LAIVYVRQSSPHQVLVNRESLELQYDLASKAMNCGWDRDRVRTIDSDLGRSGRTASDRPGFQELVTLVNLEQVGILFAYDVTRLARNCTDWYQLLDLCSYRGCLVGDQDGVYDPATPNGRLILGLKGLISELELHTLRRRMIDGLLNKARRGELAQTLPVGLVRDASGQVIKRPDREVQGRLDLVFATFLRVRSVSRVVRFFSGRDLRVPRPDRFGDVVWRHPTNDAVHAILTNPAYAGAFVYGRTRRVPGPGPERSSKRLPEEQWQVCILGKYPAYIDWETFARIQAVLHDNYGAYRRNKSRGVPRSGPALLHGIVYCGECGHKLGVRYKSWAHYCCPYLRNKYRTGSDCLRAPIAPIDAAVVEAFLEALAPAELDLYARALTTIHQEEQQVEEARRQHLERLRYQAHLAERQFNRADPDNRLVAGELERRWEAALRELMAAEEACRREEQPHRTPAALDATTRRALEEAGQKIPELWRLDLLCPRRKKALLRCLIEKVVVRRPAPDSVHLRVIWKGGDVTTREIPVTVGSWAHVMCAEELERAIVGLAQRGRSDEEIASELTGRGYRSPRRLTVSLATVRRIRRHHGLFVHQGLSHPRRIPGYLTVPQVALRLKVQPSRIYARIKSGAIKVTRDPNWKVYLFRDDSKVINSFNQLLAGELQELRF